MTVPALQQAMLMLAESAFVGLILLAAYRLRDSLGVSVAYVIFGIVFLYASFFAEDFYVQLTPWLAVTPGCGVFLPGVLFFVLVVYLSSDAMEARKLIYGVSLANIAVLPLGLMAAIQLQSPLIVNPDHLVPALFTAQPRIVVSSAVMLLLDSLLVVLAYEAVSRYTRSLFLRITLSLAVTLLFDSIGFVTMTEVESPAYGPDMLSQIVAKTVAAVVCGAVGVAYLRWFGVRESVVLGEGQTLGSMFRILTYRQRYEELQRLLVRDTLTGVYNRRFFETAVKHQIQLARQVNAPLCLMMVDVDNFKRVNDTYGHTEGDTVLQLIAKAIGSCVRTSDDVCRYGGEEFAVLVPRADLPQAVALAERICAAVPAACASGWAGASALPVSVTIGVAAFPADALTDRELVVAADRRLYAGKSAGRNRVVGVDSPASGPRLALERPTTS